MAKIVPLFNKVNRKDEIKIQNMLKFAFDIL